MKKVYTILVFVALLCISCNWQLKPNDGTDDVDIVIDRYDRVERLYLTTGDLSALQQMNTTYPMQTRTLIENILCIGKVDTPDINTKLLHFFQDATLQRMLADVERKYADVDDLNEQLTKAFKRLKKELPEMTAPKVYTQIGSFDQSIVVDNNMLGISLDKYLGEDYPFYQNNYTPVQRRMMVREMIVPDCLVFYLLSAYPPNNNEEPTAEQRMRHMGRIQWVVNRITGKTVFDNAMVAQSDSVMSSNKAMTVGQLLEEY